MAKKKTPGALAKRVEQDIKKLEVIEKDLARVRENLRNFLEQPPVPSGPVVAPAAEQALRRKIRRR